MTYPIGRIRPCTLNLHSPRTNENAKYSFTSQRSMKWHGSISKAASSMSSIPTPRHHHRLVRGGSSLVIARGPPCTGSARSLHHAALLSARYIEFIRDTFGIRKKKQHPRWRILATRFGIADSGYQIAAVYQILATRSWLPDLGYQILPTRSWLPDRGYQILATSSWLPDLSYQILAT